MPINTNNVYQDTNSSPAWSRKKNYALMLAISSVLSTQLYAQDEVENSEDDAEIVEEIVVRGMRQSIESAQQIKRDAETVVDSITAEELGSFPDKSIAEALQRVPGITVNRFAAATDTAHFSAEPSGVLVRGLNHVRTEFNGRDSFSANSSRGLSWGDVSPELMAGVDTYKNQMAELVEGGIAGTVNMRTRLPFNQDGLMAAATIGANYGDLAEEVTPEGSALISNRWDTASGEWGALANIAYSDVTTRSQGNQFARLVPYRDVYEADSLYWIPSGLSMRDNLYFRTRLGGSAALQWQNLDETVVVTTQYNRSEYENAWEEYVVNTTPGNGPAAAESIFFEWTDTTVGDARPRPLPGTNDFTFDENGVFQTGTMVVGQGWWGSSNAGSANYAAIASGLPVVDIDTADGTVYEGLRGIDVGTVTRSANNENVTEDLSLNVKWSITDSIRSSFDIQRVEATVKNWDIEVGFGTFADAAIDFSADTPSVDWLAPTNINMTEGGWSHPNNYRLAHIMDHFENSEGDELAFRADFEFDMDFAHVESIKVGARYADRDQIVRSSNYNWESVATTWSSNQAHYYNLDRHEPTPGGTNGNQPGFTGYPEGYYELRTFDNDYHDINVTEFFFADMDLLQDQQRMIDSLGGPTLGFENLVGWEPVCSGLGDRSEEIDDVLCITPAEWVEVSEETTAAYVQLNFGGDDATLFGVPYSGNLGVRYVETENVSEGGYAFNPVTADYMWDPENDDISTQGAEVPGHGYLKCEYPEPEPGQDPRPIPGTMGCYISVEDALYSLGDDQVNTARAKHKHALPSFNIKLEFTEELQGRLGLSRAMSRPDIGNLRNFVRVSGELPDINNANDPDWVKDGDGNVVGANVQYSGSAHNPYLRPIIANQADITLEWYFEDDGSLTGALFYKEFDDYIQSGRYERVLESNGIERIAVVQGPQNGEGAKIQGFEIAYQDFFDFLPEPFDGFGMQANYTFIDNEGIETSTVSSNTLGGAVENTNAATNVEVDVLQSLSKHTFNLIGMFEKGSWAARLAYNWRSEYMVTAVDCCIGRPMWQDAYGQLDGSIKYEFIDNLEVALKFSNLLNEETVLEQQVQNAVNVEDGIAGVPAGKRLPASWFQNDRRVTLSMSFRY